MTPKVQSFIFHSGIVRELESKMNEGLFVALSSNRSHTGSIVLCKHISPGPKKENMRSRHAHDATERCSAWFC